MKRDKEEKLGKESEKRESEMGTRPGLSSASGIQTNRGLERCKGIQNISIQYSHLQDKHVLKILGLRFRLRLRPTHQNDNHNR